MDIQKSPHFLRAIISALALLVVFSCITYYADYFLYRPRFVRYDAFGIDIPVNYPIHGIDVSHYQSDIDWTEVKQMQIKNVAVGFCFIKATEGVNKTDANFRRNWYDARQNRITVGAYHFFHPECSGKYQALNFAANVRLEKGDLPPVLDVEQANPNDLPGFQRNVQDWLTLIEKKYHTKPILYTNADFYARNLGQKFDDYPLWVAHYLVKDKPRVNRKWDFWQHHETGHVNGIDRYVDFNVFNGDSTSFRNLLLK